MNGRDLAQRRRGAFVIDLFGMSIEEARTRCPAVVDWLINYVKPERDQNRDDRMRKRWWLHGRERAELRSALASLSRFIATPETAKHRFFVFLDKSVLPDNKLIAVASSEAWVLGVLLSEVHQAWALAMGGRLGVGNDPVYQNLRCFDRFAFPAFDEVRMRRIRILGEQLDAHRKRQQALHPELTMTGMYNVLERLRSGEPLTAKERQIHDAGLVSVLRQIHDDLDAAVFDAYGWPHDLSDEQILERLVALNAERAAEESRGLVRWLRPDFQCRQAAQLQPDLLPEDVEQPTATKPTAPTTKQPWPKTLPDRFQAVRTALSRSPTPATAQEIAAQFKPAKVKEVAELLQTLAMIGHARALEEGRFVA
jgi:hypothetical protein